MSEHEPPSHEGVGSDGRDDAELRALFQRAYLLAAAHDGDVDPAGLRAAVCAFVRGAKARHDPPERVLAALKSLTIDGVDPLYRRGETPTQRVLHESVFRWFLDEYYGPG